MIEHLKELLSIESVAEHGEDAAPYGKGPAKALDYCLKLCADLGFHIKNAGGKYAYAEIGTGPELIGILGHLDVVPPGEGWDYEPFAGTVAGDRLYGRGSIDDKGPMMASIYAMKDILDGKGPINKRARLIFGQTEENGEWIDIEAYKENEEIPNYGFTPDGDFPALYGEKGIMLLRVTMKKDKAGFIHLQGGTAPNAVPDFCRAVCKAENGTEKTYEAKGVAAHGSAPWAGENAITKLMKTIDEEMPQEEAKPPFLTLYQKAVGDSFYGESAGIDFSDAESGKLSLNAGMIEERDEDFALYLDIRYPVTESEQHILETFKKSVIDFDVHVDLIHHMKPVYMSQDGPVMTCLLNAYRKETGDDSPPLLIGGGTYARSMDNIIAFGPNFPGHENREHKENEYILIDDLEKLRSIYRSALEGLLRENISI